MKKKKKAINVPLKRGISDTTFVPLFSSIVERVKEKYDPEVVVFQCGSDGISGDPLGGGNLTTVGMGDCLKQILEWNLPLLILGGGGYNNANTARVNAYLTSIVANVEILGNIPDKCSYFEVFKPDFEVKVWKNLVEDKNSHEEIEKIKEIIFENLNKLK